MKKIIVGFVAGAAVVGLTVAGLVVAGSGKTNATAPQTVPAKTTTVYQPQTTPAGPSADDIYNSCFQSGEASTGGDTQALSDLGAYCRNLAFGS